MMMMVVVEKLSFEGRVGKQHPNFQLEAAEREERTGGMKREINKFILVGVSHRFQENANIDGSIVYGSISTWRICFVSNFTHHCPGMTRCSFVRSAEGDPCELDSIPWGNHGERRSNEDPYHRY